MKLDGVPPGVSSPSPEFGSHHHHRHNHRHNHRSSESPDSCGSGSGWVPSHRSESDNIKRRRAYAAAAVPQLEQPQDRPPMSVVVVRGMPPLPYNNHYNSQGPNMYSVEPAVSRIYQPSNCFNGFDTEMGSDQTNFSLSSFRLQPRGSAVTRSINVNGGIRGRKRTATGFVSLPPSSHNHVTSSQAKSLWTVNSPLSSHHDVDTTTLSTHYQEVDLACSKSYLKDDVAISSPSPLSNIEPPQSPHVFDTALVTLQSLTLRSPGGLRSPRHDTMNSPNSTKRPRGSSFSVYHGSPAGSLPSASSTNAKLPSTKTTTTITNCNSARSSPRVVPLTVIMADHLQNAAAIASASEMVKTPTSRPPFIGVKPPLNRESSLDSQSGCMERRAVVSFESPMSSSAATAFGVSPSATATTTPLPRITLTPRSSTSSRDSRLPILPSTAAFEDGNDDELEASPMHSPPGVNDHQYATADSMMLLHNPLHRYHPRRLVGNERPMPVYQHKRVIVHSPPGRDVKYKASTFQYCGSSNSLALSADGSQDERSQPLHQYHHMSPILDDTTRPQFPKSFLPFPNWLDTTSGTPPRLATISGGLGSPGTDLSPDSGGRIGGGTLDIPTPQRTNCGKAGFPLSNDEPLFGVRTKSLFSLTTPLTSRTILQSMVDNDERYTMDAETGSLSDSDEDDEPFVLASPKQIAEERLLAKRARLRLRWIGDVKDTDNLVSNTFDHYQCPSSRTLSLTGTEGASTTSLFGMDIPQDEPSASATTTSCSRDIVSDFSMGRLLNPNSISYTSFLSSATTAEDATAAALEPTTFCRRSSDGSLGSLGLSLEIVSANANHMASDDVAVTTTTTGRDLITPPLQSSSQVTELSPPPFAPKQDPFLFADHEDSPSRNNDSSNNKNTSHCFLPPANRTLVNLAMARMEAAVFDSELDGGVDDDDDASCDQMTEDMS